MMGKFDDLLKQLQGVQSTDVECDYNLLAFLLGHMNDSFQKKISESSDLDAQISDRIRNRLLNNINKQENRNQINMKQQ